MNILSYTFFQNALLGSLLASILCGFVGTYIVARRLVFISGGITHASFGGIGLGVLLGINPILSAMGFSVLSAFGVQWMSHRGRVREDSAIAVFWTFGMSLGIICCFMSPGFIPDLPSFLFGSILSIGHADLWLLGGLTLVVVIIFRLLYYTILSVAFDPIFARSQTPSGCLYRVSDDGSYCHGHRVYTALGRHCAMYQLAHHSTNDRQHPDQQF